RRRRVDNARQQRDQRHPARQARGRSLVGQACREGLATSPQHWFSDEDRVVVLTQITVGGEQADQADVLTYRDGNLVKFQTAGDTALFERVFGSK
ncbi:MAG: hypothetical protein ACXVH3_26450, partial [Solirubrobacteraceae bacterium]